MYLAQMDYVQPVLPITNSKAWTATLKQLSQLWLVLLKDMLYPITSILPFHSPKRFPWKRMFGTSILWRAQRWDAVWAALVLPHLHILATFSSQSSGWSFLQRAVINGHLPVICFQDDWWSLSVWLRGGETASVRWEMEAEVFPASEPLLESCFLGGGHSKVHMLVCVLET